MGTRNTALKIPNLPRIDQNDSLFRPAAMEGRPKGSRYFPSRSVRAGAVLPHVKALPGAEREPAGADRDRFGGFGDGRARVGGHVVGTFVVVDPGA